MRPMPAEPRTQPTAATGAPRSRRVREVGASFAALAATVVAFSGGWVRGGLVIDGPGIAIYLRLALRYLAANGRVPYWIPDMWAGSPVWAIGPSFPAFLLLPFAAVLGPEGAVRAGILLLQIAGSWGAFVLTRSLWKSTPAALVAGVVYGISPLVVLHAALIGNETAMGVIAAAPWLTWALRHGLRGHGTRYVVGAGIIAAFAVLHQAEYAYGLALLGVFQVLGEIGRSRRGMSGAATLGQIFARTGAAVGVCLGLVAYWIVPFLALSKSFVLSPPELVQSELLRGVGRFVANELGVFVRRAGGLDGVVSVYRENLTGHAFYLGIVPVVVTCLSALIVARRRGDSTFSGILVAAAGALWLSTGAVALVASGPVLRNQVVPMVVLGTLGGVVAGGFVRRLGLRRATVPALAVVLGLLVAVPYVTPFLTLQRLVPLLDSVRVPRFYVIAILALALGTAWPVAHIDEWLPHIRLVPALLSVVLIVAVVVDAWPYRSFYWVRTPESTAAYDEIEPTLAAMAPGSRIATSTDPTTVAVLIRRHQELSMGWPHPVAYGQLWRLTLGAVTGPPRYAQAAMALSSTAYFVREKPANQTTAAESITKVELLAVPHPLPRVRAYDQTVLLGDETITPELAAGLAAKNVAVVTATASASRSLTTPVLAKLPAGRSCQPASSGDLSIGLAGEIAAACGVHEFIPLAPAGAELLGPDATPGSTFTAVADGLQGVSLWIEGKVGNGELVLREKNGPDEDGRVVARTRVTGVDQYGLARFGFDPIPDSGGKRYSFAIECPDCFSELEPQLYAPRNVLGKGNLTVKGRADADHNLGFTPVYERMVPQAPSETTVSVVGSGPGHWTLESSGSKPSLVVVADANFPGWRARVDGRRVPVLEADGGFLSVAVDPGQHRITFDYGPGVAALVGRLITLGTLLAIVGGWLTSRRRRLRHTLEVGTPAVEGGREEALGAGHEGPGLAITDGQGPGAEGDEAVLTAGGDGEPGGGQHP